MNVIDEWLNAEAAKRDALKFKRACDNSLDALRYCAFIQGRSCDKTELASSDNWPPYLTKVYGEPPLKFKNGECLEWVPSGSKSLKETAKKYGCDLDFTINWDIEDIIKDIDREKETNKMREEYCFCFNNDADVWHKIDIERSALLGDDKVYHVRLYRSVGATTIIGWDFIRGYFYRTWDQLSTQLICDIHARGVDITRSGMDVITSELDKAKRSFLNKHISQEFTDLYQLRRKKNDTKSITAPFVAMPKIKMVIFNNPATIVFWRDGSKTIVKMNGKDKKFDPEKGLAMAIAKKCLGNEGNYYNTFAKFLPKEKAVKKSAKKGDKNE